MTLIVSVTTPENVIQVSDRRLTRGGRPWENNANKSLILECRDGLYSIAYTGMAYIGSLPTDEWIRAIIQKNKSAFAGIGNVVFALSSGARQDFTKLPVADRDGDLSITIAGWHWIRKHSQAYIWTISNIVKQEPSFTCHYVRGLHSAPPGSGGWLGVAGTHAAVDEVATKNIWNLIHKGADSETLVKAMVHLVRASADHPKYGELIGKDCLAVILPRDSGSPVRTQSWPDGGEPTGYAPAMVGRSINGPALDLIGAGVTMYAGGRSYQIGGSPNESTAPVIWSFAARAPRRRPS